MADLKIDEQGLIRKLERDTEACLESLRSLCRHAVDDIRMVADASAKLPKQTGDLIQAAHVARIYEARSNGGDGTIDISVYGNLHMDRSNHEDRNLRDLRPGRYRVVVLLIPVDE